MNPLYIRKSQAEEQYEEKQRKLEAEKKRLDDLKYIEKLAREDHNMVGKDEVPLFIVDEKENKDSDKKNR